MVGTDCESIEKIGRRRKSWNVKTEPASLKQRPTIQTICSGNVVGCLFRKEVGEAKGREGLTAGPKNHHQGQCANCETTNEDGI